MKKCDLLSTFPVFALFALVVSLGGCSGDKAKGSTACTSSRDCSRGAVCDSGTCVRGDACDSARECTGDNGGVTCLMDERLCSAKECADRLDDGSILMCSDGRVCVESGAHIGTCIDGEPRCANDSECEGLAGARCCGGNCRADCPAGGDGSLDQGLVTTDLGSSDASMPSDGPAVEPDGPPGAGAVCSTCRRAEECAALGALGECVAVGEENVCTRACDPAADDCPAGTPCHPAVRLCLPVSLRCGCLATGCDAGKVCDPQTTVCTAPRAHCGACLRDLDCAEGLTCGELAGGRFCFAPCGGGCADGLVCENAQCQPETGQCDACGGRCVGATPVCNPGLSGAAGMCGVCGPGVPCANAAQRCNPQFQCVDAGPNPGGECETDLDCAQPQAFCVNRTCVACLETRHCPARNRCDQATFSCLEDPCGGVECQIGSVCDAVSGRCEGGCRLAADCGEVEGILCNAETGQCYYGDGSCDIGGGTGVCGPGSACEPGPLTVFTMKGVCTCSHSVLPDEANPFGAPCVAGDQLACQPGTYCSYFVLGGMAPPPMGSCGADLFGACGFVP